MLVGLDAEAGHRRDGRPGVPEHDGHALEANVERVDLARCGGVAELQPVCSTAWRQVPCPGGTAPGPARPCRHGPPCTRPSHGQNRCASLTLVTNRADLSYGDVRNWEQYPDVQLLVAARTCAEPFGVFYERHFASVLAFFRRRVQGPEEAFDLAAETFAAALDSVHRYPAGTGAGAGVAVRDRPQQAQRGAAQQSDPGRGSARARDAADPARGGGDRDAREARERSDARAPRDPAGRAARCDPGASPRRARLRRDRGRAALLGERRPQARESWPGRAPSPASRRSGSHE